MITKTIGTTPEPSEPLRMNECVIKNKKLKSEHIYDTNCILKGVYLNTDKNVKLGIRMTERVRDALKERAKRNHRSMTMELCAITEDALGIHNMDKDDQKAKDDDGNWVE